MEKELLIRERSWSAAEIYLIEKLEQYPNDYRRHAHIILAFYCNFLQPKLCQVFARKIEVKLLSTKYFERNICPKLRRMK